MMIQLTAWTLCMSLGISHSRAWCRKYTQSIEWGDQPPAHNTAAKSCCVTLESHALLHHAAYRLKATWCVCLPNHACSTNYDSYWDQSSRLVLVGDQAFHHPSCHFIVVSEVCLLQMACHVKRFLLLWQPSKVVCHCAFRHVYILLHDPWVRSLPQINNLQPQ